MADRRHIYGRGCWCNADFTLEGIVFVRKNGARCAIQGSCNVGIVEAPTCNVDDLASRGVTGVVVYAKDHRDCLGHIARGVVVGAVKSLAHVDLRVSDLPKHGEVM